MIFKYISLRNCFSPVKMSLMPLEGNFLGKVSVEWWKILKISFNSFSYNFFSISIISYLFAKRLEKSAHANIKSFNKRSIWAYARTVEIVFHFHCEQRSAILWFFNWKAILLFDSKRTERKMEKKVQTMMTVLNRYLVSMHNRLQKKWTMVRAVKAAVLVGKIVIEGFLRGN